VRFVSRILIFINDSFFVFVRVAVDCTSIVEKEPSMKLKRFAWIGLLALMLPAAGGALAAEQNQNVYGWQLMTPQERTAYQEKMRSLNTQQERDQFRMEHHKMMQERAKEQGVTLPDVPRHQGGMGGGSGMGGGPGKGQ
jgi:hypothetical protein